MPSLIPQIIIEDQGLPCPLCLKPVDRKFWAAKAGTTAIGHYECLNCGTQFDVSFMEDVMVNNKITYKILGIDNVVYHHYNPSSRRSY